MNLVTILIVVVVLVVLFGGGGYYGYHGGMFAGRPGYYAGGLGLGTILIICLVLYLLGVFR